MVIQNEESILVMPIKDSQEVKKIYERLQKTNSQLIEYDGTRHTTLGRIFCFRQQYFSIK